LFNKKSLYSLPKISKKSFYLVGAEDFEKKRFKKKSEKEKKQNKEKD
jgi:hypothetical protein